MNKRILFTGGEAISTEAVDASFDIVIQEFPLVTEMVQNSGRIFRHRTSRNLYIVKSIGLAMPRQTYEKVFLPGVEDLQSILRQSWKSEFWFEKYWLYFCVALRVVYLITSCISDTIKQLVLPLSVWL